MARYRLFVKPSAAKEIGAIGHRKDRERIVEKIEALADAPRPEGGEKLAGGQDTYRVRQGNYRIVYEIRDDVLTVLVVKVGHRRDVYRG